MATYLELHNIATSGSGSELRTKILVAITVKANALVESVGPAAAQLDFARSALRDPKAYEQIVMNTVLSANKDATVPQITGATDATVQAAVDGVVDKLLGV